MESVLMVVGLYTESVVVQDVYQISLERPDSVWKVGRMPTDLGSGAAGCVMGDTLYAVGIGHAYNELWKWNEASDWTRCAVMTSYIRYHCVAVVDSLRYTLGGWNGTMLSSVEAYNTQTNKWSAAGQVTHAVSSAACVSYNNSIYVFGGYNALGYPPADVQVYDAAQQKCTLLHNAMPRAYAGMRAVVWETYAILLGRHTCFIYNFELCNGWKESRSRQM